MFLYDVCLFWGLLWLRSARMLRSIQLRFGDLMLKKTLKGVCLNTLSEKLSEDSGCFDRIAEYFSCVIANKAEEYNRLSDDQAIALIIRMTERFCEYYVRSPSKQYLFFQNWLRKWYCRIAPMYSKDKDVQGWLPLFDDFAQDVLSVLSRYYRRNMSLPDDYQLKNREEVAKFLCFAENYLRIKMSFPSGKQVVIIRDRVAKYFNRLPKEKYVAEIPEYSLSGYPDVFEEIIQADLSSLLINDLIVFLREREREDLVRYTEVRLKDFSNSEIEELFNLSAGERDDLNERFKWWVMDFAASPEGSDIYHFFWGIDLGNNLGLSNSQFEWLMASLDTLKRDVFRYKQEKLPDDLIAARLGITKKKVQRSWKIVLKKAHEIRLRKRRLPSAYGSFPVFLGLTFTVPYVMYLSSYVNFC